MPPVVRELVVIGAAMSLFAGCGGDSGANDTSTAPSTQSTQAGTAPSSSSASPTTNGRRIVVEETEYRMKPNVRRIPLGTYVFTGVNRGKLSHVLEVEGPGSENETATIPPGESKDLELILRTPGKYELYCPLDDHKKKGMVATLIVGKA
jgi:uncharacterized cupredoxin-like copper-binding protein